MRTPKPRASTWASIRSALTGRDTPYLLALVKDLYALSPDNRHFLEARFKAGQGIAPYLKTIEDAVYPDVFHNKPLKLSVAKRAIGQYRKASGDLEGTLELMTVFCERGTQFTVDYGGIDDAFYHSIEATYRELLDLLKGDGSRLADRFAPRLAAIRDSAEGIGWGFYEGLSEALAEAFPKL